MRLFIVSGSFKDVFSPSEAVDMLGDVFTECRYEVTKCPFCDGGEYTYDVLKNTLVNSQEILVDDVLNAYGKKVKSHYLIDNKAAHIVSSEILRLYPEEDEYKNPAMLTDFGYGQLIADALGKGVREIRLYLGGTSTVGFGMGMLQALGGKLYDSSEVMIEIPATLEDLPRIKRISIEKSVFERARVTVIADGDAKADEMDGITRLKIGRKFVADADNIADKAKLAARSIEKATGFGFKRPFSGAAGGLLYGIDCAFDASYILGGEYFINFLGLKRKIAGCDYVVTGEGRYDNTACGKAPASIAGMASSLGKPVVLVCGQIDKDSFENEIDYSTGIVLAPEEARNIGITKIITCQRYYNENTHSGSYLEQIRYYREMTPKILKELVKDTDL